MRSETISDIADSLDKSELKETEAAKLFEQSWAEKDEAISTQIGPLNKPVKGRLGERKGSFALLSMSTASKMGTARMWAAIGYYWQPLHNSETQQFTAQSLLPQLNDSLQELARKALLRKL